MSYCVPIEVDAGHDQDQAVAICEQYWRDRDKSMEQIRYKEASIAVTGSDRKVRFVASDESEDRMGDIIRSSGWDLTDFKKNPVLLWGHDSHALPIGTVPGIGVSNKQLIADVEFATSEQNDFAEKVYQLVKAGIVRAVSVGFSPIEYKILKDSKDRFLGYEFIKQDLHELSVVAVPANANALAIAKHLNFQPNEIKRLFSPPVVPDSVKRYRTQLDLMKMRV